MATQHGSPSVHIEKGTFRMRTQPPLRPPAFTLAATPRMRTRRGAPSNTAIAFVLALALASSASFSLAYYLFTTRWSPTAPSLRLADDIPQVASNAGCCSSPTPLHSIAFPTQAKFLSYLPHSGLHNQRIALENALILGALTNRTILVPPIRLGHRLQYSVKLRHILDLCSKTGLAHCSRLRSRFIPPECLDLNSSTHVSPAWLFNLSGWQESPPLVHLADFSTDNVLDRLQLAPDDVLTLSDTNPYQYRFLDTNLDLATLKHKYNEVIYIPDLANDSHRLIELGSLFGSSRLRLRIEENRRLRKEVRRHMTFASPHLVEAVDEIEKSLGGDYFGAHIRLGDGTFRQKRQETLRQVRQKLVHDVLQMNLSLHLSDSSLRCRGHRHTSIQLDPLNRPLFISTDVKKRGNRSIIRRIAGHLPVHIFPGRLSHSTLRGFAECI
ncbi:hypothetical protein C8F01DRAFT_250500 [Mycena amicta]|nr:hypothetical protein C8F01DRAFT_250500 [Mycena amicta]